MGVFKLFNNITSVNICCDEGDDHFSLETGKVASDQLSQVFKLDDILLVPVFKSKWIALHLVKSIGSICAPHDLGDTGNNLSIVSEYKLLSSFFCVFTDLLLVVSKTPLHEVGQCKDHLNLKLIQPRLDISTSF